MKNESFLQALSLAASGIAGAFRSERNLKIDCCIAVVALALSALFQINPAEWCCIIICIGLVFSLEIMNTAVEAAVDLASPKLHPLAKRAKDCAAGAVLFAAMISVCVAGVVFAPRFIALFA